MSRATRSVVALAALLALTGATWAASDGDARTIAALAGAKIAIVGMVFLELDRAWPGWAVVAILLVGAILGGAVWLA